jgi:hypothetical protein
MATHQLTLAAAGIAPSGGALAGLLALAALAILDRIPLSAYRPRQDDGRTPRYHRRAHHDPAEATQDADELRGAGQRPVVTIRRARPPLPPRRRALPPRPDRHP